MKIDVEDVKARFPIDVIFELNGHKLIPSNGHKKTLCPFHKEKSPSCCVYSDHFYCYGCHASGDVIGYVMRRDGLKFKEAVEKLLGKAPFDSFKPRSFNPPQPRETPPLPNAAEMLRQWKHETDFDDLDLHAFELGVSAASLMALGCAWAAPYQAWAFPMKDSRQNTVGIRLRAKDGRKWAVKGSKEGLFYKDLAKRRTTFVCEGPTDAAAGLTLDLNIVGRPSCQGAVKEIVKLIDAIESKDVVIISDNDAPGMAGSERLQSHLNVPYREVLLPCKDLRNFLILGGTRKLLESIASKQLPKHGGKQK